MFKRITSVAVAGLGLSCLAVLTAPPAAADLCATHPIAATTGVTVGAAGEEVRVPSITDVQVCIWTNNTYGDGVPRMETQTGCGDPCFAVIYTNWNLNWDYGIAYRADGAYREVRVDPPPVTTGPAPTRVCLFAVGAPADTSCLTYVSIG